MYNFIIVYSVNLALTSQHMIVLQIPIKRLINNCLPLPHNSKLAQLKQYKYLIYTQQSNNDISWLPCMTSSLYTIRPFGSLETMFNCAGTMKLLYAMTDSLASHKLNPPLGSHSHTHRHKYYTRVCA